MSGGAGRLSFLLSTARTIHTITTATAISSSPPESTTLEDFDARFELTRQFLGSLRTADGSYRNVHMEVLAPDAVVVTRYDDLTWTDTTGTEGEYHSAGTWVLRRIDGEWKIIYGHESLPLPE